MVAEAAAFQLAAAAAPAATTRSAWRALHPGVGAWSSGPPVPVSGQILPYALELAATQTREMIRAPGRRLETASPRRRPFLRFPAAPARRNTSRSAGTSSVARPSLRGPTTHFGNSDRVDS